VEVANIYGGSAGVGSESAGSPAHGIIVLSLLSNFKISNSEVNNIVGGNGPQCNGTDCPPYSAGSASGIYVDGPSVIKYVNVLNVIAGNAVTGENCSLISNSIYAPAYGIQGSDYCNIENSVINNITGGWGGDCCASGGLAFGVALQEYGYLLDNIISNVIGGDGGTCLSEDSTNFGGASYGFKFQNASSYFAGNQIYNIIGGVAGPGSIAGEVATQNSLEVDYPFFQCSFLNGGPICEPFVSSCCVDECVIVNSTDVVCLSSNKCDTVYCNGVNDYCPPANRSLDACGECGGDNSSCASGCDYQPYSNKTYDVCGVCGGNNTCFSGCDYQPYSNRSYDACGVCGGDNSSCVSGCDTQPNSNATYDVCGVCGGNGTSCLSTTLSTTTTTTTTTATTSSTTDETTTSATTTSDSTTTASTVSSPESTSTTHGVIVVNFGSSLHPTSFLVLAMFIVYYFV